MTPETTALIAHLKAQEEAMARAESTSRTRRTCIRTALTQLRLGATEAVVVAQLISEDAWLTMEEAGVTR